MQGVKQRTNQTTTMPNKEQCNISSSNNNNGKEQMKNKNKNKKQNTIKKPLKNALIRQKNLLAYILSSFCGFPWWKCHLKP
jgi:hypothetical protein